MKKIFMQEWMGTRPYRTADAADTYYVGIANKVADILKSDISDHLVSDHHRRYIGIFISNWFEDIISGTGAWKAFNQECLHGYGCRVPLFDAGEAYYEGEVNDSDVRFLVWHYLQVLCLGEKLISPVDASIMEAARKISDLLSAAYETAPENDSLREAFFGVAYGPEDFSRYMDFLRWYHFRGYMNCMNLDAFHHEMDRQVALRNGEVDEWGLQLLQHSLMTDSELFGHQDLLSLTSVEWLARIGAEHPETQAWTTVKASPCHYFLFVKKDENYVYLQDLVTDQQDLLPVRRESFDQQMLQRCIEQEFIFMTTLVQYMGEWYQQGLLYAKEKTDHLLVAEVAKAGNAYDKSQEKADCDRFLEVSDGRPFVFFRQRQEVEEFVQQLGMDVEKWLGKDWKMNEQEGVLLTATPEEGMWLQLQMAHCLKSPVNPCYDEAAARKDALSFLVSPSVVPYSVSCAYRKAGMLEDALFNSRKGEQYGAELVQRYGAFLTDYYFQQHQE